MWTCSYATGRLKALHTDLLLDRDGEPVQWSSRLPVSALNVAGLGLRESALVVLLSDAVQRLVHSHSTADEASHDILARQAAARHLLEQSVCAQLNDLRGLDGLALPGAPLEDSTPLEASSLCTGQLRGNLSALVLGEACVLANERVATQRLTQIA